MYWNSNAHIARSEPINDRVKFRHYQFAGTVKVQEYRDSPTETFRRIAALVRDSQDNARYTYQLRDWARVIAREYGAQTHDEIIYAVWDWLRRNMVYVNDPAYNELIHSAEVLMRRHFELGDLSGDCDDFTILACALLLQLGVPCKARMIKLRQADGSYQWAHIYPMALSGSGRWVAMDATEPDRPLGWEPPHRPGDSKDFRFA